MLCVGHIADTVAVLLTASFRRVDQRRQRSSNSRGFPASFHCVVGRTIIVLSLALLVVVSLLTWYRYILPGGPPVERVD